ncbi:concanavalin A-like lectin/glucanase superfamily protein [Arcicella aurantiaca]|uniref:Concanavalin A-like lectin/glucanase superfamily protein n=1 Tax=Arcicella aurantiaca TaxID=591202 RepID=A0A316ESP3_9BACT|nr:LamG domain-containing protein [Arcicella aurantiaca]PWK26170.1 concanavalin A-like lectin/glucanase superfamily protein [Arcicella aurantiaca]
MKCLYTIVLLMLSLSAFSQVDLKNGLVACYTFNANAKDESGNGNHGTVNGATLTTDRLGKPNSAYRFDGYSYISLVPEPFKNKNYSYSLWVNLDELPFEGDNNSFFSVGGPGADQSVSVLNQYGNSTNIGFNAGGYNTGSPAVSNNLTGTLPTIGKWYHVVSVRDNISVKLYVDGVLIANNSANIGTNGTDAAYANPTYAEIGSRVGADGYFQSAKAIIDDIHIYNRAITADEAQALFDGKIISITANQSTTCGGEQVIFTANGASVSAKYQWKVDGVNVGSQTSASIFSYDSQNKASDYQVKISVEVIEDDLCFPNKISTADATILIKNCNPCEGITACIPFTVLRMR